MSLVLAREPFEVSPEAGIVQAVRRAGGGDFAGDTPWMDAALLSAAGIESVVIGPHGAGAHADVEWVDLASTYRLAEILRDTAISYCLLGRC
jgi:acetylornithine deacetylase